jgi:hypothetical protein
MPQRSDTEIVFADLESIARDLMSESRSPVIVRRRLHTFAMLTAKLTATMRTEFHRKTGRKWEASRFKGWTETTALFHYLRNCDLHEMPLKIGTSQVRRIPLKDVHPQAPDHLILALHYDQAIKDQLADNVVDTVSLRPGRDAPPLAWSEWEVKFLVEAETEKLRRKLTRAGTREVRVLVTRCISTLQEYYQFYQEALTHDSRPTG